jgi:pimeloyl-ACP methyl ester carboxylesterase
MGRGWKIAIGILVGLAVLLAVNSLVTESETKSAEVTEPGGRILHLRGGDIQVVDRGPRDAPAILLVHCFSCAINWWDGMIPLLERTHRVIAVDMLGHGGSEKPASGYTPPNQADLIAQALAKLDAGNVLAVGHSLGGSVVTALAERSPDLVRRVAIIDTPPTHRETSLGLLANAAFAPVIGPALWRIKPDFSVRKGLEVAFAPGFDVPDEFVEDVKRMTYTSYHDSPQGSQDYSKEEPLSQRIKESGKPLMVIMGAEEQIVEHPREALAEYLAAVPSARLTLMKGVGHSPNVEAPARTARLVLAFDKLKIPANRAKASSAVQAGVQKQEAVRARP